MGADKKKQRGRWWWIGGAVGLIGAGAVLIWTGVIPLAPGAVSAETKAVAPVKSGSAPAEGAGATTAGPGAGISVTVAPVTVRPIQRFVEAVGTFSGFEELTVMAEASGRVVKVYHEVGDVVRPGDLLVQVDPTDYELAVQENRSALEAELARLGLTELPKGLADLMQHPMVQRAIKQEDNWRRKLQRAEELREQKTISQEELEQMQTDYQVSINTRLQMIMEAQAILAAARHRAATLATAQEKLGKTRVGVPLSDLAEAAMGKGQVEYVVAERKISEGEMVKDSPNASMAVFDLAIDKLLKLFGNVPERYIGQVQQEQKVEVRVEAFPGKVFQGTVSRVSPTVDRVSRTFEVEVLVPNPTRELRPGGFAKLAVLTHHDTKAITMPDLAVSSFAGSTKVFVVRDGKAHAVPVEKGLAVPPEADAPKAAEQGAADRGWVEVIPSGPEQLDQGEPVITSGVEQLAEGMAVRIRNAEAKLP